MNFSHQLWLITIGVYLAEKIWTKIFRIFLTEADFWNFKIIGLSEFLFLCCLGLVQKKEAAADLVKL